MLSDMENVLHSAASQSPFPRYVTDLTPAQARVIEDLIRRVRAQLLRVLAWQHMKPKPPDIPATRAVTTQLAFIDIAVEELKPSYMRGYGAVPEDVELRSLIENTERYVRQKIGVDLESRLRRLEETGCDVALLQLIEEIATRHGLVEFRSRIASGRQQPGTCPVWAGKQRQVLLAECAAEHRCSSCGNQSRHGSSYKIAIWPLASGDCGLW
jgi:hypothetical protein